MKEFTENKIPTTAYWNPLAVWAVDGRCTVCNSKSNCSPSIVCSDFAWKWNYTALNVSVVILYWSLANLLVNDYEFAVGSNETLTASPVHDPALFFVFEYLAVNLSSA